MFTTTYTKQSRGRSMTFRHLYHRIKYRKQLKQGFKLIGGNNQEFLMMNDKAFIMNGQDPMVRVDLTSGVTEQYDGEQNYITTYKYKAKDD